MEEIAHWNNVQNVEQLQTLCSKRFENTFFQEKIHIHYNKVCHLCFPRDDFSNRSFENSKYHGAEYIVWFGNEPIIP